MKKNVITTQSANITPCQVLAEKITILADHDHTGSYEVFLHNAAEGAGPPPHSHPWDEAFYVIDGEVDFVCGETSKAVKAGGFVHVPAGIVHAFRYASPTAQILGISSAAGAATFFSALDRECGETPDMDKVVSVISQHEITLANQPD
jgi:quercetin dioxygenase-like cupin family protein